MNTMAGHWFEFPVSRFSCLLAASLVLAGCGGTTSRTTNQIPTQPEQSKLNGKLTGGQFPVTGATIQLYAAGTTGYGSAAQALFSPARTTDQNGGFSFTTSDYSCPAPNAPTYIVAIGGDPGLGVNNPYIALMAALGPCGSIGSMSFIDIDEVTTVASVWALTPFMSSGAQIGTSSTNSLGLTNAFATVNNVADVTRGISPGVGVPAGAVIPTAKIYTLANILASCVNSTGTAACNALFTQATPPGGTSPSTTLDAALDIARNPANNVAGLFALVTPQPVFSPSLSTAPKDWTLALSFRGGGLDIPASIAVDASGNVWAANVCGSNGPCSSAAKLSPVGQPLSPAKGYTDGSLFESYGLALDSGGNVWVTNQQSASSVNSGNGSVAELTSSGQVGQTFSGGGVYFPAAVAADTDGSVWVANQGDSTASKLASNGSAISGAAGWGSGHLSGPVAVAIDASHNAWFANLQATSGSVTSISSDGSTVNEITSGGYQPSGIATDQIGVSTNASKGHVWVANYFTSSVSELRLNTDGTQTVVSSGYTGGGISHPNGIAVDGSGNVWVTDFGANALSELEGENGSSPGQPLSPPTGLGGDANMVEPYGIAIDASGNVWISNSGSDTITQFLGLAAPVRTPLVGPPQLP